MSLEIFCQGRSVEIIFQYNGGFCSRQCVSMKQRHVFTCTDQGSGGPPAVGLWCSKLPHCYFSQRKWYVLFRHCESWREKYTWNEQRTFRQAFDCATTINIFESQGGSLLQVIHANLSCSQPLFLFDKLGSSQITQWVEISDPVDTDAQTGVSRKSKKKRLVFLRMLQRMYQRMHPRTHLQMHIHQCSTWYSNKCTTMSRFQLPKVWSQPKFYAVCQRKLGCHPSGMLTRWDDGAEDCFLIHVQYSW